MVIFYDRIFISRNPNEEFELTANSQGAHIETAVQHKPQ